MVCNSAVTTADFADEHSAIVIVESLDDATIVIVDCDSSVATDEFASSALLHSANKSSI